MPAMKRNALVQSMLSDLAQAGAIRQHFASGPLAERRTMLRAWQAARLACTHQDLLASPRTGKAAAFFLTDLYAPDASSIPYAEAERAMPITVRLLPVSGLETIADAWHLDAISESLDAAVLHALGDTGGAITPQSYAGAYREAGRPDDRARQIALIGQLAYALERFGKKPFATTALAMMREPARLAGFGDLQAFLERGLAALHHLGSVNRFIDAVTEREAAISAGLFEGRWEVLG
jgi:hypothetical protein